MCNLCKSFVLMIFVTLSITCSSCAGMLHSIKLPLTVRVLDVETKKTVTKATVELQWRCGIQGYYWGKPVKKTTDDSGMVSFATPDIPPVSEDGYSLGGKIDKIFISTILVYTEGYKSTIWAYPEKGNQIEVFVMKGRKEDIYRMPDSP